MTHSKITRIAPNPSGLCQCGCGERTPLAPQNCARNGLVKGEHMRFIRFHQQRMKQVPPPVVVDRGYKTPCWEWAGFREHGYGVMGQPGTRKVVRAHIAFYEEKYGPVPEGYELDHLCKNKPCCNPDHVEPVTHTENMRRSPTTKLTPDDVRKIREMKPRYLARELADMFGVTISAIYSIASRKTWQDIE